MEEKVPKIRFTGFEEQWKKRKLGEVGGAFQYGLNASAIQYDGKHKYIRITDIDDDSRQFSYKDLSSPNVNPNELAEYKLSVNDIVFARTGASVGKTYMYNADDGDVFFAGFLIRTNINTNYDVEFVFQNTLTNSYEKFIKETSQRSGQPGVNAKEYSEYTLMCPSLSEQKTVGNFLKNIDRHIYLHQQKLDKLKTVKKSCLEKMFPKKGEAVPEVRFEGFEGPWRLRKFEDFVTRLSNQSDDTTFPRIEYEDIEPEIGLLNKDVYSKEKVKRGVVFGKGDVLYGKLRPYLHNWLLPSFSGLAVGDFWVLHPVEVDPAFLYRLIQSNKFDEVANQSVGTKMPRADWELVSNSMFYLPQSLAEQNRIGCFFLNLDNTIILLQQKLDKLKKLKKILLDKMFV